MDWFELWKGLLLGLVEGMTEFAPVSSTGHMIIFDDLWLQTKEFLGAPSANTFKIVIQLGSILAVVVVMWRRMLSLIGIGVPNSKIGSHFNLGHVVMGIIPAGVFGVLFEDFIDENLFSIETVIIGLVIGAVLMIMADKLGPNHPKITSLDELSYGKAFQIGLIQCLSLWPGFSRSGATISGGVLLGVDYKTSADFTFIMAVPIMAGASGLSLFKNWDAIQADHFMFYVVGFISAFIFALVSIKFFLALISRVKLTPFAIYRLVVAAVLAWFVFL